jgi:hypothetical protein
LTTISSIYDALSCSIFSVESPGYLGIKYFADVEGAPEVFVASEEVFDSEAWGHHPEGGEHVAAVEKRAQGAHGELFASRMPILAQVRAEDGAPGCY